MRRRDRLGRVPADLVLGRLPMGFALVGLLLLGACQERPEVALDAANPHTVPVRTISSFDEALRCMDDMFAAQGKHDIYITTAGIPDATGLIEAGTKEMFITAVSRMSEKSNAFRFVDYDPRQLDVALLSQLVGLREDFVAPSYYVRGAITQLDSGVLSSSESATVSVPFADLGISRDQVVSVVSLALNVGKLVTRQIIPGISANNSIAVVQSGKGADTGGLIGKAGLSFSISLDRSEGFHQAVRTLVELSTIEVLGKLTRTPYWQCLSIPSTNPTFRTEARQWFEAMHPDERERFVREALQRAGTPASDQGGDTPAGTDNGGDLSAAIASYQAANDLVPTGRIDFDLYYRLLASDARHARGTQLASTAPAAPAAPVASAVPLLPTPSPVSEPPPAPSAALAPTAALPSAPALDLDTPRGPHPSFHAGESMTLRAEPAQDAYVYCYYQDAGGTIVRIFPNRFQPDPFIRARTRLTIPPASQGAFSIRFDTAGARESVICLAADREVGLLLPDPLKRPDLAPLPIHGLDEIAARFHDIAGAHIAEARLPIEVTE
jgi:Domain of unknown function (DUF4384)